MHALTCDILDSGNIAYAMIPTYYDPSKFIAAKVYIEHVWHSEMSIFYHCIINDLLDDISVLLQTIPSCQLRVIERSTGKVMLMHPGVKQFDLTVPDMLSSLQSWQKDYVLDLPAPFIAKDEASFATLQHDIKSYYETLLSNITRQLSYGNLQ